MSIPESLAGALDQAAPPGATAPPGVGAAPAPGAGAAPGRVAPPGVPDLGVGFDVPNPALVSPDMLTRQFQAIRTFERTSQLPAPMPDRVKTALLVLPDIPNERAMARFLDSLQKDLAEADRKIMEARSKPAQPGLEQAEDLELRAADNIGNDFRLLLHDVAGGNIYAPPAVIGSDPDSPIIAFKRAAIEKGLLPADTKLDASWNPALNNAYFELKSKEIGEFLSGERQGAVSTGKPGGGGILGFLDEWTSPSSLISSAASVIGLPDLSDLGDQFNSWGDNIAEWIDDPLDLKKLGGALGPIDDIIFPAMNIALLASGVGGVATMARMSWAGQAQFAGRWGARLGATATAQMAQAATPGLIGGRLAASSGAFRAGVGSSMNAWRAHGATQTARKLVGEGMKLGFAGQLEAEISPDRKLWLAPFGSVEQTAERRIEEFKNWRTGNPWAVGAASIFEVGFTPASVLKPGRVMNPAKDVWKSIPDRILKVPLLSEAPDAAEHSIKLTADSWRIINGTRDELWPPGVSRAVFNKMDSPLKAVAYYMGASADDLMAGGARTQNALAEVQETFFNSIMDGALDKVSEGIAAVHYTEGMSDEKKHMIFMKVRGHREALLRDLSELVDSDMDKYERARTMAAHMVGPLIPENIKDGAALEGWAEFTQTKIDQVADLVEATPDEHLGEWAKIISNHQEIRMAVANDLLDHVDESLLQRIFSEQGASFRYGPQFRHAQDGVREMVDSGIQIPKVVRPDSSVDVFTDLFDGNEELAWMMPGLTYANDGVNISTTAVDRAAAMVDTGRYSITPGALRTMTTQQAEFLETGLTQMLDAQAKMKALAAVDDVAARGRLGTFAEVKASLEDFARGEPIWSLSEESLKEWAKTTPLWDAARRKDDVAAAQVLAAQGIQFLANHNYDMELGFDSLDDVLETINKADFWKKAGIQHRPVFNNAAMQLGETDLATKLTELKNRKWRFATEVDVQIPGGEGRYRAVIGDSFLRAADLRNMYSPLADIQYKHVSRRSMGLFGQRLTVDQHKLQETNFRNHLVAVLREKSKYNEATEAWELGEEFTKLGFWENFDLDPYGNDVTAVIAGMSAPHNAIRTKAAQVRDHVRGVLPGIGSATTTNTLGYSWMSEDGAAMKMTLARLGITGNGADAVIEAARRSVDMGWEYQGLASMGTRLSREGWLRQISGGLRYHPAGEELGNSSKALRVLGFGAHTDEQDVFRSYKAIGAALAMGVFQGVDTAIDGGDTTDVLTSAAIGGAAAGAAVGASAALEGKGAFARTALRYAAFDQFGGVEDPEDFLKGMAAATVGTALVRGGAGKTYGILKQQGWGEYSKVGERFERIRNQIRFGLSPIFDVQRRIEGLALGHTTVLTTADGRRVTTPTAYRPMNGRYGAIKRMRDIQDVDGKTVVGNLSGMRDDQIRDQIMEGYKAATRGQPFEEAITLATERVVDAGMTGFSPQEAMASAWVQLRQAGVDNEQALDAARRIYAYGSKARSGLEQSVNFVFFPFSFQKQYLGRMAEFFSEDLGRLMLVQNSLKAFELLEQETSLADLVEDRLPMMRQVRKLNNFAYGISPGQFGGINAPYIDALRRVGNVNPASYIPGVRDTALGGDLQVSEGVDAVINLFVPQGLHIESVSDVDEFSREIERVLPLWRDTMDLKEDVMEAHYVATSPSLQLKKADEQDGWDRYTELKDEFAATAAQLGVSYGTLRTDPRYEAFQTEFLRRVRELEIKHPAWMESRSESTERSITKQSELRRISALPETDAEEKLAEFVREVKQVESLYGLDIEDMPGGIQRQLRRKAQRLAVEEPKFRRQYERFFLRSLGPIELRL